MSVAFRREGDDEHLEPKFEIPLPPGPNLVTARGLAMTQDKVTELETALTALGDEDAKKAQRELRYWRTRLATAQLMPSPAGNRVEFGCAVRIRLNGKERAIMIVGDDEADPTLDLVSFSAPLARAMMGAEIGEFVDFQGRADAIELLDVRPGP